MISPEEIRRKAQQIYPEWLVAWLRNEPAYFPRAIPFNRELDAEDHAAAIAALRRLRDESKQVVGWGYSIDWRERRSRAFGKNQFPEKIFFETADDLTRFAGKSREFARFSSAAEEVRREFPELLEWIARNAQRFVDVSESLAGLLEVVRYLRDHPRPMVFARELPLSVDSKFIERHEATLRDWLDLTLPPHHIRSDERRFARRYGLREPEVHVLLRFLDETLRQGCGSRWSELSLPLSALAMLDPSPLEVVVIENKVNLLAFPARARTMALGALGRAVTELRDVAWLTRTPLWYWGDLDVEGFEILASLRRIFPQVRSVAMDQATFMAYRSLAVAGVGRSPSAPRELTDSERIAFELCRDANLRIEQERLPTPELR